MNAAPRGAREHEVQRGHVGRRTRSPRASSRESARRRPRRARGSPWPRLAGVVAGAEVGAGLAQGARDRVADLVGDLRAAGSVHEGKAGLQRGEAPADGIRCRLCELWARVVALVGGRNGLMNRTKREEEEHLGFRVTRKAQASWQGSVEAGGGRLALGSGAFEGAYSLKARVRGGRRGDQSRGADRRRARPAASRCRWPICSARPATRRARIETDRPRSPRAGRRAVQHHPDRADHDRRRARPRAPERFDEIARAAKDCTVSRALTGTEITLSARLAAGD